MIFGCWLWVADLHSWGDCGLLAVDSRGREKRRERGRKRKLAGAREKNSGRED